MKTRNQVYIVGAGGHARVITEILEQQGHTIVGFLDDNEANHHQMFLGRPIVGSVASLKHLEFDGLVIAIGNNTIRRKIIQTLSPINPDLWLQIIHPATVISPSASIGQGSVIIAGAILNAASRVGDHCIINTAATVGHDTVIGNYVHIGSGAHLGSGVTIGDGALVGIGACVMIGCTIGEGAIVGAGACVIRSVPAGIKVVGVPAKPLRKKTES